MKSEAVIFLSSVVFLSLLSQSYAAGGGDDALPSDVPSMEAVVVTATRAETARSDVAANIEVVTREDISLIPAENAAEAMKYVPGVYMQFSGGPGSQAAARIQGSEFRHVAVVQDNVPLNLLANPFTDLSGLSVEPIERIEVYKGPASAAWGSSLGGVINIVTREPDPTRPFTANARSSYGEHQTVRSRGTVSGVHGTWGGLVSFSRDESDGFMDHTDFERTSVYGKLNRELGETSRFNVAASYAEGDSADPVLDYPEFWDDAEDRRYYVRALAETSPFDNLDLTLESRYHAFEATIEDVYPDRREIYLDYEDELWGVSGRATGYLSDSNTLNAGFDFNRGRYDWIFYDRDYDTRDWGAYVNDVLGIGPVTLNLGGRYDDNRDFGTAFSPNAGVIYRSPSGRGRLWAQAARGFSAPPPAWVHDPVYGNPDLDPETAVNYQAGGELTFFGRLTAGLSVFQADVDDLIRYDMDARQYENIDRARRRGVEGTLAAAFDFGLRLSFSGCYTDVRDRDTDKVINDIPRTQLTAQAIYTHNRFTHSLSGLYTDHNSSFPETRDERFVFDYLASVRLPVPEPYGEVNVFGAVRNLFDSSYIYRDVWPQPDRWVEGGLSFNF